MNFSIEDDGSLVAVTPGPQAQKLVNGVPAPVTDAGGKPVLTESRLSIAPWQIAAHRRNPAFEAALQAGKDQPGGLTSAQLAALPAALPMPAGS